MIQALPETESSNVLEDPRTRIGRIIRQWWWVALLLVLLFGAVFLALGSQHSSQQAHPRNPTPEGSMALVEILKRQGVDVQLVTRVDALRSLDDEDVTIFVANPSVVTPAELGAIRDLSGDVTIGGSPYVALTSLTDRVAITASGSALPVQAECSEPDAAAASRISLGTGSIRVSDGAEVTGCFPMGDGFGYAVWTEGTRTFRVVADRTMFTNSQIDEHGHAALALRSLGHHSRLLYYLPETYDAGNQPTSTLFRSVPPVVGPLLVFGGFVAMLAAVTYGRRMGPIVQEELPVIVKPGEAVYGRGRLYHRAGATGHAAQGMRAGTARRIARRLGLSRAATPDEVTGRAAAASGWPEVRVRDILYGPPPRTSAQLVELATTLKQLEDASR